jgi:dihydroflavonol-4-reductase
LFLLHGVPDISLATVDVRDVAQVQINETNLASAKGRYILSARKMISLLDIAKVLRKPGLRSWLLPRNQIPRGLVQLTGPLFGLDQSYIRNHVGVRFEIDNTRSVQELKIAYRPIEQTLMDHCRSWVAQRTMRSE